MRDLKSAGYLVIVVTNQPDVGTGRTPRAIVEAMHDIIRSHARRRRHQGLLSHRRRRLRLPQAEAGHDSRGRGGSARSICPRALSSATAGATSRPAEKPVVRPFLSTTAMSRTRRPRADQGGRFLRRSGEGYSRPRQLVVARGRCGLEKRSTGDAMESPSVDQLTIKIFADGADLKGMKEAAAQPLVKGFTTNPTLMRQAGITDYKRSRLRCSRLIPDRPVSFEVFADDFPTMEAQAREIASWGSNVYVKVPVTNTKGEFAGPLITQLSRAGVKLNVTAIMTNEQVKRVARRACQGCTRHRFGLRRAHCRYRPRSGSADARALCAAQRPAARPSFSGRARASSSIFSRPTKSAAISSP